MIYIETDNNGMVARVHYKPFDKKHGLKKSEEELKETGFLVKNIPQAEKIEGKAPELYYSEEKGLHYQYVDVPLSNEERIADLEDTTDRVVFDELQTADEQKDLRQAIDTLILDNLMRK